jgi:hypothetical protein
MGNHRHISEKNSFGDATVSHCLFSHKPALAAAVAAVAVAVAAVTGDDSDTLGIQIA